MKLYAMENQEWCRDDLKRGAILRSKEVYECEACKTRTNRWEMGGYPTTHPVRRCPGETYEEHDELLRTMKDTIALDIKLNDYRYEITNGLIAHIGRENASRLIGVLSAEHMILKVRIDRLRKVFLDAMLNDVVGIDQPDTTIIVPVVMHSEQKKRLQPLF